MNGKTRLDIAKEGLNKARTVITIASTVISVAETIRRLRSEPSNSEDATGRLLKSAAKAGVVARVALDVQNILSDVNSLRAQSYPISSPLSIMGEIEGGNITQQPEIDTHQANPVSSIDLNALRDSILNQGI